jgi:hypothetical protein
LIGFIDHLPSDHAISIKFGHFLFDCFPHHQHSRRLAQRPLHDLAQPPSISAERILASADADWIEKLCQSIQSRIPCHRKSNEWQCRQSFQDPVHNLKLAEHQHAGGNLETFALRGMLPNIEKLAKLQTTTFALISRESQHKEIPMIRHVLFRCHSGTASWYRPVSRVRLCFTASITWRGSDALASDIEGKSRGTQRKIWRSSRLSAGIDVVITSRWETRKRPGQRARQIFVSGSSHYGVPTAKSFLCLMKNRSGSFLVTRYMMRVRQWGSGGFLSADHKMPRSDSLSKSLCGRFEQLKQPDETETFRGKSAPKFFNYSTILVFPFIPFR